MISNKQVIAVIKTARIKDKATGHYWEEVEFPVSQTEKGRLQLLPSIVSDKRELEKKLRDAGARLPNKREARENLLTACAGMQANRGT